MLATRTGFNPFEMPTTLQAFPHGPLTYFKNVARGRRLESLQSLLLQVARVRSWLTLGKRRFDAVLENGGVWHLVGHSWEIEQLGLWDDLGEILDYVSRRDGVRYVPNCALLEPRPIASSPASSICEGFARRAAAEVNRAAIPDEGRADQPSSPLSRTARLTSSPP
jgi:hypothetical protein